MSNFKEISQQLLQSNAMIQLTNRHKKEPSQALTDAVMDLLQDKEKQTALGKNALDVVMQNQGATQTTLSAVHALLNTSTSPNHLSEK
jgi:3-deoxy-D-manno-octulosonic-acid transferase